MNRECMACKKDFVVNKNTAYVCLACLRGEKRPCFCGCGGLTNAAYCPGHKRTIVSRNYKCQTCGQVFSALGYAKRCESCKKPPCGCGCGLRVVTKDNKFIRGHRPKTEKVKRPRVSEGKYQKECQKCGNMFKFFSSTNQPSVCKVCKSKHDLCVAD
jgi:hypothetical protein